MARLYRLLWLFLLLVAPAFADPRPANTKSAKSERDTTAPKTDTKPILADEHGTLVLAGNTSNEADGQGARPIADRQAPSLVADDHGTLLLASQEVLADKHGTLVLDMGSPPRLVEPG